MFRKDNFVIGAITGVIFSGIMYLVFSLVNEQLMGVVLPAEQGLSDQFIAILAVCSNILPFLMYNAANKYYSMRGILGATMVMAGIIIFYYRRQFF